MSIEYTHIAEDEMGTFYASYVDGILYWKDIERKDGDIISEDWCFVEENAIYKTIYDVLDRCINIKELEPEFKGN